MAILCYFIIVRFILWRVSNVGLNDVMSNQFHGQSAEGVTQPVSITDCLSLRHKGQSITIVLHVLLFRGLIRISSYFYA